MISFFREKINRFSKLIDKFDIRKPNRDLKHHFTNCTSRLTR